MSDTTDDMECAWAVMEGEMERRTELAQEQQKAKLLQGILRQMVALIFQEPDKYNLSDRKRLLHHISKLSHY